MVCLSGFELYSRWVPLSSEQIFSENCRWVPLLYGSTLLSWWEHYSANNGDHIFIQNLYFYSSHYHPKVVNHTINCYVYPWISGLPVSVVIITTLPINSLAPALWEWYSTLCTFTGKSWFCWVAGWIQLRQVYNKSQAKTVLIGT